MKILQKPKVSVSMLAYNHEKFISKAIDSVMMQEIDCNFELIIGEDCSTDNTRKILRRFREKFPSKIFLREYSKNVGSRKNYMDGIASCRGDYIAILDGDDYWLSKNKLAEQVEYLDNHKDFSFCFHPVKEQLEDGPLIRTCYPITKKKRYELKDMAEFIGIGTSSVLFRRNKFCGFPDWFSKAPVGDWPLFFLLSKNGSIGYIDKAMSVHRLHAQGSGHGWRSNRINALKTNIKIVKLMMIDVDQTNKKYFKNSINRRYYDLAHAYLEKGDRPKAIYYFKKAFKQTLRYNSKVYKIEPIKILMKICVPGIYGGIYSFYKDRLKL
jgi:glycosyltransferase involved in cell wall biosynthesis